MSYITNESLSIQTLQNTFTKESLSLMLFAAQTLATTFYFPEKHVKNKCQLQELVSSQVLYAQNSFVCKFVIINPSFKLYLPKTHLCTRDNIKPLLNLNLCPNDLPQRW